MPAKTKTPAMPRWSILLALVVVAGGLWAWANWSAVRGWAQQFTPRSRTPSTSKTPVTAGLHRLPLVFPATKPVQPVFITPNAGQDLPSNDLWHFQVRPVAHAVSYHWYILRDGFVAESKVTRGPAITVTTSDPGHRYLRDGSGQAEVWAQLPGVSKRTEAATIPISCCID